MPVLDVVPAEFGAAATLLGETVAVQLRLSWQELVWSLDGCGGMAGSDEAGAAWGASYESVARSANLACVDLLNSCYHLGALLDQTGVNYALAEAGSTTTGGALPPAGRFAHDWCDFLPDVPDAVEQGTPPPQGWSLLQHLIQRAWPDGHQDRLRRAAAAWRTAARQTDAAVDDLTHAYRTVYEQGVPESDAAATVLDTLGNQLVTLAQTHTAIAEACEDYAHHLDTAHHAIISELRDFLIWTAGLEVAGGLLSIVTLGISEALAQGSEAIAMARFANTIRRYIEVLIAAARSTSIVVDTAATRVELITTRLQPLLAKHLEEVRIATASDRGEIVIGKLIPSKLTAGTEATTPTCKAVQELEDTAAIGPASETWADSRTLARHFEDHGADFGAATEEQYASMAAQFLRRAVRDKLPMKIDREDGTIRVYDPDSNTFGCYRLNGRTRSFFKPKAKNAYWERQPGELK